MSLTALALAALFFFQTNPQDALKSLKPSQLDFVKSNEVQAPMDISLPVEVSVAQPVASEFPQIKGWPIFEEILKSKNDNDPRIEKDLKNLTLPFKSALYARYESIAPEDRNGRGLIVFLIARELKSADDVEFLRKVFQEQPCLSLDDCKNTGSDDPHFSGINQTTLNYPQLAALFQIEIQLQERTGLLADPEMKSQIQFVLKQAESFSVPAVSQKAAEIRKKFNL